jgi:hypothetical protein
VVGPQAAVVSGGILCLLGVVAVARWFPELVGHTIRRLSSVGAAQTAPTEAPLDSGA